MVHPIPPVSTRINSALERRPSLVVHIPVNYGTFYFCGIILLTELRFRSKSMLLLPVGNSRFVFGKRSSHVHIAYGPGVLQVVLPSIRRTTRCILSRRRSVFSISVSWLHFVMPGFSTSSYYNDFKVYKLFVGPKVECLPIRLEYNNSWCVFLSILCQWIYLVAFRSRWCLFPLE